MLSDAAIAAMPAKRVSDDAEARAATATSAPRMRDESYARYANHDSWSAAGCRWRHDG